MKIRFGLAKGRKPPSLTPRNLSPPTGRRERRDRGEVLFYFWPKDIYENPTSSAQSKYATTVAEAGGTPTGSLHTCW
jgi:hypothetical protein